MKKKVVLSALVALIGVTAASGWAAGTAAQSPALPAASGQTAAADKDLIELLPRSTVVVMVLDIKRLLEIDAIAKALEGPEFKKFYDEFVNVSGIDPKRDVAYVGWGIPASAIAARLSMPTSPVPFKDFAMVVGLTSDKTRIQGLVKENVPEAKQGVYNGVAVFSLVGQDKPAAETPGVPAGVGTMILRLAFLDDTHIVLGDDLGVKGVIDVTRKRAESLAKVPEMAAFMIRVDKSGIAWSAVSYPPEQAKMIADSNPLLKALEGFKGIIMAIDDKDSTLIVDLRTLGGTTEQNAAFASNLNGIKSVGALYAAEQPALGELLNGIAITSGEDYTRLNLTVSHETVGKLWRLVEPKGAEWMTLSMEAEALYRKGDYERALEVGNHALEVAEKNAGPDHPDTAVSLNLLALLLQAQGQYAEAEPLYKRALAIYEKSLGPDDPNVATCLANIGSLCSFQARYAEAEPLFKRSLAIREKAFGPDHPDVATVLDDLARTYYYERQYAKAESLWTRLLAIREQALGPDDPDVAESLKDLAMLFHIQGQYAKAEPLYERSLAIREKALGPDDPDVDESLSLLAELYRATKREKEAKELEVRVARIRSIKR